MHFSIKMRYLNFINCTKFFLEFEEWKDFLHEFLYYFFAFSWFQAKCNKSESVQKIEEFNNILDYVCKTGTEQTSYPVTNNVTNENQRLSTAGTFQDFATGIYSKLSFFLLIVKIQKFGCVLEFVVCGTDLD